jgi:hypothetical protein
VRFSAKPNSAFEMNTPKNTPKGRGWRRTMAVTQKACRPSTMFNSSENINTAGARRAAGTTLPRTLFLSLAQVGPSAQLRKTWPAYL